MPASTSTTATARPTRRGPSPQVVSCGSTTTRCAWTWSARTPPPRPRCRSTAAPAAPTRRWRITTSGTIVGVQSGLCLDVTGAGTANSTTVGLWTCNGQSNQRWTTAFGSADSQPPTAPGSPRVSDLTCNSVTFAWNASTDNVARGVLRHLPRRPADDVGERHDALHQPDRGGRGDLGPVRQRPRRRRQRVAGERHRARSLRRTARPTASHRRRRDSSPAPRPAPRSTLRWTAPTDNIGVRAYDIYRGRHEGRARSPARAAGDHVHRQRPGGEHLLPVLRRGPGRAGQRVAAQQHRDRHHRRGVRQPGVRGARRSPPTPTSRGVW